MSQVSEMKYRNRVCPFCGSKKIKPVEVYRFGQSQHIANPAQIGRTGRICDNCHRYHPERLYKYTFDRAEMKRDIKRLQKFLKGAMK